MLDVPNRPPAADAIVEAAFFFGRIAKSVASVLASLPVDTISVFTGQGEAWKRAEDFALQLFMKKMFFLESVSNEIQDTRLVYFPYWVVELQNKNGGTFRKAIDAIHGEPNNRLLFLMEREGHNGSLSGDS